MATLNHRLKAITENLEIQIDASGKSVEVTARFGSSNFIILEDLNQLIDLEQQLSDAVQTLVNELNQMKTVELQ